MQDVEAVSAVAVLAVLGRASSTPSHRTSSTPIRDSPPRLRCYPIARPHSRGMKLEAKLAAAESKVAVMEGRSADAFARITRANEDAETLRGKLRAEHAAVQRLTKQLEVVTARSQRLAKSYQRSRALGSAVRSTGGSAWSEGMF